MLTETADRVARLSLWLRVREFAVPPSMIEIATVRRSAGDWAGACAAAGFDVDLDLRSTARTHGRDLASRVRTDLRSLAPDLLRWHLPRVSPDGLLRPGLTVALARYDTEDSDGLRGVHLVARTPPVWADGGQRISLALWDGSPHGAGAHPRPRPSRRFRLDLHRHLWDVRRADELRFRSGADRPPAPVSAPSPVRSPPPVRQLEHGNPPLPEVVEQHCAVDRWAAEARILLRSEGRSAGTVIVRLRARHRLVLGLDGERDDLGPPALRVVGAPRDGSVCALPVLPDAATWVLPDLELLRSGSLDADRLHPLVAAALAPDARPSGPFRPPDRSARSRVVECRGARHRLGLVNGVLTPLDHGAVELRREELLLALTGTPMPCLRAVDEAHRHPERLTDIRERLNHGDTAGALAVVEELLGPAALLRTGALRDALEAAVQRRISYGLFRAGLAEPGPRQLRPGLDRPRDHRSHPRHTTAR
ncbi:hypothetical protein ACFV0R_28870 [Streptomyces sp. NPDC059578]|uniref:hypothetical protein n=1 Tax=Streptomyces sp. NPDC059578 TaxID=3346874 RepID=UPI00368A890C